MKKKFFGKNFWIIIRDILTIFIGYYLTDLITESFSISDKYGIFIYLGILLVITILGITIEKFIRKQKYKKN